MRKFFLLLTNIISISLLLTGCAHFNSKLNDMVLQKAQLKNGTVVSLGYLEPTTDWNCKSLATLSYKNSSFQLNPVKQSTLLKNNAIAYANKIGIKPNYISLEQIGENAVSGFYQCQTIKSYSYVKEKSPGVGKTLQNWIKPMPQQLLDSMLGIYYIPPN